MRRLYRYITKLHLNSWVLFFAAIYLVLVAKISTFHDIRHHLIFGIYSIVVSFYILSRFTISHFHEHDKSKHDRSYEPTITFGIPSKDEEENIRETIMRIARVDYPHQKFNILAINDGSTDNTLSEMYAAAEEAKKMGVYVKVVDWKKNRGKRDGMAECVKRSKCTLIVFIDSDSFIDPHTPKELVKYFTDPKIGAVAGHAYVANASKNIVTKMQAVRYFVAFKAYKGTESVFGTVTCCSGCCSAYRRKYVASFIDEWLEQTFLGVRCTYGDDRSLTNYLLKRGYKALYSPDATAYTFVPDTMRKFMRQQLRWKKSWVRESLIGSKFMWKKHPIMSLGFYIGVLLPLLAPIIVFHAVVWYPVHNHSFPLFYLFGLILMSCIYGLYYRIYSHDKKWVYGALFAVFYTIVLIWQLPYAILTLRDSSWGTR
jgi:hyaluronan synthase